jgi:D-glycero-alpha-D-manno-heptose-7-phosphate kinase
MIISMTPLRISFLGGGTDYPEYFREHGGTTLCTSINKYVYITVSRLMAFAEHRIRVSYSRTELCETVEQIQHPSVRECLRYMKIDGGLEINVVSDLPARTGLGSSSSFTVGLLHALHGFRGNVVGREQLAAEAVHVERTMIAERVGLQDQYACACGGLLRLKFSGDNQVSVSPLAIPAARLMSLEQRLMIFYTGRQRNAHEVVESQITRTASGAITPFLDRMQSLVDEGVAILNSGQDLSSFGQLLHESWALKRQFSEAICPAVIQDAYERARDAGAVGGKLLGAGGGGFLLMYVEPDRQSAVRQALAGMVDVPIAFEKHGSQLIFYRP